MKRYEWKTLLVVLLAAFVFRGIFFQQVENGVIFHAYRLDHLDQNFYYRWARIIAAGDWLTDRSLHPYHFWHQRFGSTPE